MSKVITRGFGGYQLVVTRGFGIEYIPKLVLVSLDCLIQTARDLVCGVVTVVSLVTRIQKERTVEGEATDGITLDGEIGKTRTLDSKID